VTARLATPEGYTYESGAVLKTPLSDTLVKAVSAHMEGRTMVAEFRKADIDNNVPAGASVPLVLTANFLHGGVQKALTSSVNVAVTK
jgi:hypothetical protein